MKQNAEKHYIERKCSTGTYCSVRMRYRSEKMNEALEFAKHYGGILVRHKGGIWSLPWSNATSKEVLSMTIHALVRHGLANFTKHQKLSGRRIPIEIRLTTKAYR